MPKHAETRMNGINIEKKCTKCDEFKPLIDFYRQAHGYYGTIAQCRKCSQKYAEDNKEQISERMKDYYQDKRKYMMVENLYGLNRKQYEKLCKDGCRVCGSFDRLSVDHNHTTNSNRGILCKECNTALGILHEDINRILKLAHYLEERSRYAMESSDVKMEEK